MQCLNIVIIILKSMKDSESPQTTLKAFDPPQKCSAISILIIKLFQEQVNISNRYHDLSSIVKCSNVIIIMKSMKDPERLL